MIDHFGINCADFAKAQQFYDRVLGVLGYSRQMDFGQAIGYGRDDHARRRAPRRPTGSSSRVSGEIYSCAARVPMSVLWLRNVLRMRRRVASAIAAKASTGWLSPNKHMSAKRYLCGDICAASSLT
jgi:catechol 2,3-dioxygenase-like lactoylglutathione lyase family enzyme